MKNLIDRFKKLPTGIKIVIGIAVVGITAEVCTWLML